jgi:hypothetical protein
MKKFSFLKFFSWAVGVPVVAMLGMIIFFGCKKNVSSSVPEKWMPWFFGSESRLKLVQQYKPLHLEIYADTTSTNEFPDFAIGEGNDVIFVRFTELTNIHTIQRDKNAELEIERDSNGKILTREISINDGKSGLPLYIYRDTNADGLWDYFYNIKEKTFFMRSNLCWVPIPKKPRP